MTGGFEFFQTTFQSLLDVLYFIRNAGKVVGHDKHPLVLADTLLQIENAHAVESRWLYCTNCRLYATQVCVVCSCRLL